MRLDIKPGVYVAAVSGGVDSMSLLDMLANKPGIKLTVAHFDHGIRPDAHKDRELVQNTAAKYGLPFVFDEGNLGPKTSEAQAREARYRFLGRVMHAAGAQAIITAHHQDDVLETAIINMLRGTGRKGLSALRNRSDVLRPLLGVSKSQLRTYARTHGLAWREDPSNSDVEILRNYVRAHIVPKLTKNQRRELLGHVEKLAELNPLIESIIDTEMKLNTRGELDRMWFIALPYEVATETMAAWLRTKNITFDKKKITSLTTAGKTFFPGKRTDVDKDTWLEVGSKSLALVPKER